MKGQYIKIRNPMPVEEYGRSITQVPSELASSDSTGPAPVVVSGGGLGASAPTGQKHLIPFKLRELTSEIDVANKRSSDTSEASCL
jgi:hypothetical protein